MKDNPELYLILIEKHLSWYDILNLRAITKEYRRCVEHMSDTYLHFGDYHLLGTRTFVTSSICSHCGGSQCYSDYSKPSDEISYSIFLQDILPRRLIPRCNRWRCRFISITSKLKTSAREGVFYTIEGILDEDERVKIPRSDGSTSLAIMLYDNILYRIGGRLHAIMIWGKTDNCSRGKTVYQKTVPINAMQRLGEKLDDMDKRALTKIYRKIPKDVINIIASFITTPRPFSPKFGHWGSQNRSLYPWRPSPQDLET
jgi:hypothetical protein